MLENTIITLRRTLQHNLGIVLFIEKTQLIEDNTTVQLEYELARCTAKLTIVQGIVYAMDNKIFGPTKMNDFVSSPFMLQCHKAVFGFSKKLPKKDFTWYKKLKQVEQKLQEHLSVIVDVIGMNMCNKAHCS